MRALEKTLMLRNRVEVIRVRTPTLFCPADPGGSINLSVTAKFDEVGNATSPMAFQRSQEVGIDVGQYTK